MTRGSDRGNPGHRGQESKRAVSGSPRLAAGRGFAAGQTGLGASTAGFFASLAARMVYSMFAAFFRALLTGGCTKLAEIMVQGRATRHEGHTQAAKVGTITAGLDAGGHRTMVDAGTAAAFTFHETSQAGFDTLPDGGVGHQILLGNGFGGYFVKGAAVGFLFYLLSTL